MFFRIGSIVLILGLIFGVAYSGINAYFFFQEKIPNSALIFEVKPGESIVKVAIAMEKQGLISKSKSYFLIVYAYLSGNFKKLKVGEYNCAAITLEQLFRRIIQGQVVQYSVTLIPGSTFRELIQVIHQHPKIKQTIEFYNFQNSNDYQRLAEALQLEFPNFLEGQFYPETYFFSAGTQDTDLLKRAHALLVKKLDLLWSQRDTSFQQQLKSKADTLILASIIQKESSKVSEYPDISGVYQRRLAMNMPLQADPTVIYALEFQAFKALRNKSLTFKDLKCLSAYNTYLYRGLPPGPIGLVTEASIDAALHPKKGTSLYFVADGLGGHQFSDNFEAHKILANRYRQN